MPNFVMTIGLPGSGKSTWAQEYIKNCPNSVIVSSDAIREELWGDANDQQNPSIVFETMFQRTVAALKEGKDVVYDATNLVAKTRKATLARVRAAVGDIFFYAAAVFVACPISECKRRQLGRDRKVPEEVIDRMVRQFQTPWYNEGWNYILVADCEKKQNLDKEHERMMMTPHDNPHHSSSSLNAHCIEALQKMDDMLKNASSERSPIYYDVMREAAYQHDLGKYKTKVFHDTKGNPTEIAHYYSHDNVGAYLWLTSDAFDKWDEDAFLYIGLLIQWHMQPYFCKGADNEESHTKFKEWCDKREFDDLFYTSVLMLHEADKAAH